MMIRKYLIAVTFAIATFTLTSHAQMQCGGAGCAPPPPPVASLHLNCPPAAMLIDVPGQVKIDWPPCNYTFTAPGSTPLVDSASADITLTRAIAAKSIESWIGTNAESTGVEVGVDVTVTLPDGRVRYFSDEFDKHGDVVGEQWHQWNGTYNLPAGTVLHLHTVAGVTRPASGCPLGCAHEFVLLLRDELQ